MNILTRGKGAIQTAPSDEVVAEVTEPSLAPTPKAPGDSLRSSVNNLSLHRQRLVVGLDIGTSAVRASELDVSQSRPSLLHYGQVGLPTGSLIDGEIRDSSAVSAAIIKLWENGKFSSKSVIVGIAGLRAITREIDLPFVPDNEVDSAVRFQSEEVIPFPPDQTILSSQILSDYTSTEGDKMRRILVAAAHTDLVNGVIKTVEDAGLTVVGVDLISSALVRAVGDQDQSDQPEAIVSVGAGLTVVVVHQSGRPQFVRTIGSGGNTTTSAISAALGIPINDAEGLKRRIDEDGAQQHSAERAAEPTITDLVSEIRSTVQYFASLSGRLPVSRILITGGGSNLHGLVPKLASQSGLSVIKVSALDRLNTSKVVIDEQSQDAGSVLGGSIGLALPEPNKSVKKFNLLPPEVAQRARLKKIQDLTVVGCVAVLILLLAFGAWKFLQVKSAQSDVTTLQSSITTLNAEVPKYDLVVAANDAYSAGVARRSSVLATAVDWPVALDNLITITPTGALVQSFTGTATNATVSSSTAGSAAATTTTTTTAPAATTPTTVASGATSTTSAAIGTISIGVTGPGPGLTISAAWISEVAKSPMFANPLQGATVVNPGGTISFPFTISVTPSASLNQNASLK